MSDVAFHHVCGVKSPGLNLVTTSGCQLASHMDFYSQPNINTVTVLFNLIS